MGMRRRGATRRQPACSGHMIRRLLPTLAVALALAGAIPRAVHADWDDRPDPTEFAESLAPHGAWVDDAQFGHVWRPNTWWEWRPYVDGRWISTSYGWTWVSDEPWAWTFHYGRWGFSSLFGWVWTPGYVWGPAWVDWYWGDGFVGWVPLGPPGFAVVPSYWVYVHDFSFCAPHIPNVVVVHDMLPPYIVHHREQGWGVRHPPDMRDIEHVSRYRIEQAADRPPGSIAPWVEHRIARGEPTREHVADRGGERIIDHPGRGGAGHGRPQVVDDGWRRPRDGGREGAPPIVHGRGDLQQPASNDGLAPGRRDQDGRATMHAGDDGSRRPLVTDDHGWGRPAPQRSQPFEPPPPQHAGPSMGPHAGGGPAFVEPGRPDAGSAWTHAGGSHAGSGSTAMQHGQAWGTPPAAHASPSPGVGGAGGADR